MEGKGEKMQIKGREHELKTIQGRGRREGRKDAEDRREIRRKGIIQGRREEARRKEKRDTMKGKPGEEGWKERTRRKIMRRGSKYLRNKENEMGRDGGWREGRKDRRKHPIICVSLERFPPTRWIHPDLYSLLIVKLTKTLNTTFPMMHCFVFR